MKFRKTRSKYFVTDKLEVPEKTLPVKQTAPVVKTKPATNPPDTYGAGLSEKKYNRGAVRPWVPKGGRAREAANPHDPGEKQYSEKVHWAKGIDGKTKKGYVTGRKWPGSKGASPTAYDPGGYGS